MNDLLSTKDIEECRTEAIRIYKDFVAKKLSKAKILGITTMLGHVAQQSAGVSISKNESSLIKQSEMNASQVQKRSR